MMKLIMLADLQPSGPLSFSEYLAVAAFLLLIWLVRDSKVEREKLVMEFRAEGALQRAHDAEQLKLQRDADERRHAELRADHLQSTQELNEKLDKMIERDDAERAAR